MALWERRVILDLWAKTKLSNQKCNLISSSNRTLIALVFKNQSFCSQSGFWRDSLIIDLLKQYSFLGVIHLQKALKYCLLKFMQCALICYGSFYIVSQLQKCGGVWMGWWVNFEDIELWSNRYTYHFSHNIIWWWIIDFKHVFTFLSDTEPSAVWGERTQWSLLNLVTNSFQTNK